MNFSSCVAYVVKSGMEESFLAAVAELAKATRAEPGCLSYRFHRDPEDAARFFLYELYTDEAAYLAHQATPHFEQWAKKAIPPCLDERRIERYVALDL
ncbi:MULTISPECIES: putative quinol monooxygenase [unclassified Pigmentiphaga]|uniref:antibiotic biosynthesis monooxygenase n=1 Tax=unclassified Pigmentiphaga TaxID=2626614 RepID=UPI00104FB60E